MPTCGRAELAPLVALWGPLQAELTAADARLTALARTHPVVTRLVTMPSVGPVTALAFVAALDDSTRFHSAHQVQAYLGLVPSEYSSGDRRARGHITKRGDARMRWLQVETAWRILRSSNPALAGLKAWALQIAARRGKRIATVALARRVAVILYAMWRDDVAYQARTTSDRVAAERLRKDASRVDDPEMTDLGRGERDAADGRTRDRSSVWAPPAPLRTATCADEPVLVIESANRSLSSISRSRCHADLHHVSAHPALMLDTARRFTEAASGRPNMRLTSSDALASR
jgi:hypothetical protein